MRADRNRLSEELFRTATALSDERIWAEQLLSKLEPFLEKERLQSVPEFLSSLINQVYFFANVNRSHPRRD